MPVWSAIGDERLEGAADLGVAVGVERLGEAGHERVEDQQGGVDVGVAACSMRGGRAAGVSPTGDVVGGDDLDPVDAVEVGAGGHQPGDDGVLPGVLGGADEDRPGVCRGIAGQLAAGDAGGEPVGEGGLAETFAARRGARGCRGRCGRPSTTGRGAG